MENEDEDRSTEHSWKETKEKIAEKKYKYRHFLRVKLLTIAERLDEKNTKNETHA